MQKLNPSYDSSFNSKRKRADLTNTQADELHHETTSESEKKKRCYENENCIKKQNQNSQKEESIKNKWRDAELVADATNISIHCAKNILSLLDEDCTVPFIVRYRSEMSENLPADKVREVEMTYANVKTLRKKTQSIVKVLSEKDVDLKVINAVQNAKSIEELDYLYAPFKPGSKNSFAEQARQLGLEPAAIALLEGRQSLVSFDFCSLINSKISEISSEARVKKGIANIIADFVAKDRKTLDYIHHHPFLDLIMISCSESATAKKKGKVVHTKGKQSESFKFENYFNFNCSVKSIQAHQVMAINRGEKQKVLTVKIRIPNTLQKEIIKNIWSNYFDSRVLDSHTRSFIDNCIDDAYSRLLEPHIRRFIRSKLTKKAEKEAVEVFCTNLKHLLLTPPVRGKVVIGIDPGYTHGCKSAVVSRNGEVLHTDTMYIHNSSHNKETSSAKLIKMVIEYQVEVIAIGNGTGSRDTESWIAELISRKAFQSQEIKYCIVNESGASIYSVTKEADADLPELMPNLRSAVSIARRLQDPLLEYVKVEPKHLGIGMYQHDITETILKTALDGVIVECVSFVGVDLNVCPLILLRKISGLSDAKAKQIISWREKHGGFINRQQLLNVKGLGPKSFEQCAGFVKILPQTMSKIFPLPSTSKSTKGMRSKAIESSVQPNLLDSTIIHPESYDAAEKFLIMLGASSKEIGMPSLIGKVQNYKMCASVESLAEKTGLSVEKMKILIDAFSQLMEHDIRSEFDTPLFHTGIMTVEDLKVNQVLKGRVTNVTNFGAFVDVGVGNDGLIHVSKMGGKSVHLGDRVKIKVLSTDSKKKRINLSLL